MIVSSGVLDAMAFAAQLTLGMVFAASTALKVARPGQFIASVVGYDVLPAPVARVFGWLLIPVEAYLAVALILGLSAEVARPLSVAALALFGIAVGINLARGARVPCGCFGNPSELISRRTLIRLMLLVIVGLIVTLVSPSLSSADFIQEGASGWAYFALMVLVASLLLAIGGWLIEALGFLVEARDREAAR